MAESEAWDDGGAGATSPDETSPSQGRAGYARSAVREQTDRVKQRVRDKGSELKDELKDTAQRRAGELKDEVERRGDELTSRVGARVSVLARALRRAGDELRHEGEPRFADLTDEAASQVERFGGYLDGYPPNVMVADVERMARNNPALFLGGTFAIGLLVGRFLRAGDPGPDVTFEPEGEGETGRRPGGDARSRGSATRGEEEAMRASGLTVDEPGFEAAMPQRAMTPDLENLSDAHPSSPGPGGVRERFADETPVRSGFAGHETTGPGVRTGSSGAAALDAGSAGPRQDEHDSLRTRRRESGEEDA